MDHLSGRTSTSAWTGTRRRRSSTNTPRRTARRPLRRQGRSATRRQATRPATTAGSMPPSPACSRPCARRCSSSPIPSSRKVGWDLRNSQILHLVKAYKEDRYEARAGSRSAGPFFNEREEEFFRLVEQGQVYDFYFAKAQQDCPDYLAAKIRRTKQKAAWAELWKEYLEGLPVSRRPKDKMQQQAHRRKLLRKRPIRSIAVQAHDPTRDDFKQALFADVFYGRTVVDTPVTRLFESASPRNPTMDPQPEGARLCRPCPPDATGGERHDDRRSGPPAHGTPPRSPVLHRPRLDNDDGGVRRPRGTRPEGGIRVVPGSTRRSSGQGTIRLEMDVPFVVGTVTQELKALGITLAPGKMVGKAM